MTELPDRFTCQHCGEEERASRWSQRQELREKLRCWNCDFYLNWLEEADGRGGEMFVADGQLYTAAPESNGTPKQMRGFNGRTFHIDYLDGRPARITRNLWAQGAVPDEFKNLIFDTAVLTEVSLRTTEKGENP